MQELEIQDYARQLLDAHGDKAQVEAAQKARAFEEKGNADQAKTWRQIEAAIKLMRGPRES
jgi:regulator of protease activity HflC (stomatin/prohibitin superfamily)